MVDFGSLWWLWPFGAAFAGAMAIVFAILVIFWIWMIIDAAKRDYRNNVEKIVWLVIVVVGGWIGALIYFIVIRSVNPRGLVKK